jgi:AcrR family transcriptional regulator
MKENPLKDKTDSILDAAQKRFGHYGLSKTTMQEIADDIGLSKAALYYYFKDKESIFKSVAEKEQLYFETEMQKVMNESLKAEFMLTGYVELRLDLLKKLMTLGKFSYGSFIEVKPILHSCFKGFKKKEIEIIAEIIKTGIDRKEFSLENINGSAEFFVDALRGLRQAAVFGFAVNETTLMTTKEYAKLRQQSRMFVDLFLKGISAVEKRG